MTVSLKLKKWGKRILITFLVLVILTGGLIHYIIAYRFKEIIRYVVDKESNGAYFFNASKIEVSVWDKNLQVKNAVLHSTDTSAQFSRYDLVLPAMYLKIHSWKDLLFSKKLAIDSLYISTPDLKAHNLHKEKEKRVNHVSFQATRIIDVLQKVASHLEIRSFHLEDGAFAMANTESSHSFISNKINLLIHNFSNSKKNSKKVFLADDIDFSIRDQHWNLAGGKNEFIFKRLHFSGKNQFFELNDCIFRTTDPNDTSALSVSAEKIYFKSSQLASLYEKEELSIDTLILLHPVLNMHKKNKTEEERKTSVADAIKKILKGVSIKYIDIDDGQFALLRKNSTDPIYQSEKTDLKIYNLLIRPGTEPGLSTDSIQLRLSNIRFLTKDSLYELTLDDFIIEKHDVIFKNAIFKPTDINQQKNMSFSVPQIRMVNISMEDLLSKKLTAEAAELHNPEIILSAKKKKQTGTDSTAKGMDHLYHALRGLKELISVHNFKLINGNIHYESLTKNPMKAEIKNVNALILLNKFLTSDSLINIKQSVPDLNIDYISLISEKLQLDIRHFSFNGQLQQNNAKEFSLQLGNGTFLRGQGLTWHALDWDMLQQSKGVKIDVVRLGQLTITSKVGSKSYNTARKNPPLLDIGKINIDKLSYSSSRGTNKVLSVSGSAIQVDKISSKEKFINWNNFSGQFNDVLFDNNKVKATVRNIAINTRGESIVRESAVNLENAQGHTKLKIPLLHLSAEIHSSDFSRMYVHSLSIDKPEIDIYKKVKTFVNTETTSLKIPINLDLNRIAINDASLVYKKETTSDTITVATKLSVASTTVSVNKESKKLLHYDKVDINLNNLEFNKHLLSLALPSGNLTLNAGLLSDEGNKKTTLNSSVKLSWKEARVNSSKPGKSDLLLANITGSFQHDHFHFSTGKKIKWQSMVNNITINTALADYRNTNITIHAGSVAWNPSVKTFTTRNFSMRPNFKVGDVLSDNTRQVKTLSIEGNEFSASGIHFHDSAKDSSLLIRKVTLDEVVLTASKDKRIPEANIKEKPMFSQLINSVKFPFHIDSVQVRNSTVIVNETSPKTDKQGTIPLQGLHAIATNIKNRNNENDSLRITAYTSLFDNHIRHLKYSEAYGDSLASFSLDISGSPMILTKFNEVTHPLASINVVSGSSDTLFAKWTGNKYAAFGSMNFYYKDLKIQLLDKKTPGKKKLLLNVENFLANSILLNKKNKNTSAVFFERDSQKSVFNYWVKTSMSGLMTSAGIKRSKKYQKQYKKLREKYKLPEKKFN